MFEKNKNAKELGIDLTRKFKVVEESTGCSPKKGDILEIKIDDGSTWPLFWNLTADRAGYGVKHKTEDKWGSAVYWSQLEYADEQQLCRLSDMHDPVLSGEALEIALRLANNFINKPKKTIMSKAIKFLEEKALKIKDSKVFETYKAGLTDKCGNLTGEGIDVMDKLLQDLVWEEMVATAKEINKEEKK